MPLKSIIQRLREAGALQEHGDWYLLFTKASLNTQTHIICDAIHRNCIIDALYFTVFPLLGPLVWVDNAPYCLHCREPLPTQYATAINLAKVAASKQT